ncbi:MAG: hypothetical protein WCF99_10900 [Chloroflexales bacterium]
MGITHRYVRLLPVLAVLALLASLLVAAPARAASGTVSPREGGVGTRFNFKADGFEAGERVDSWVTGPDGSVKPRYPSVRADTLGGIIWSWDVAPGTANGTWNMSARGINSDVRVVIGFTVIGSPPIVLPNSVSPASGAPGSTFAFSVGGLLPGERVGAWLTQPDGSIRDFTPGKEFRAYADQNGSVSWSWRSPSDAPIGNWLASARGLKSNREVSFGFTISGTAPADPIRSVTPTAGAPGSTFTVVVGGFKRSEQVGSWLNQPDGSQIEATPYIVADGNGVATWTWQAPIDAPSGTWQAVTHGRDSGLEVTLSFVVTGVNPGSTNPNGPTISVTPNTAHPGDDVTVSIAGFRHNEYIYYWPTRPDGLPEENRSSTESDNDGNGSWTYRVPNNAVAGTWMMNALGDTSNLSAQTSFTVIIGAVLPSYSVTPESAPAGTTFHFTARGFRDKPEKVFFWFTDPRGRGVKGPEWKHNNEDSTVSWDWTSPTDALDGEWKAVAHGEVSGIDRVIPFTITRDTPAPSVSASVSPKSGGPGTTFTFTADGYKEGERVGYWLNLPDGTVVRFDHELMGNSKGEVTWSWTAPADAQRGLYTMSARSSQSDTFKNDVAHDIRFTVE